MKKWMSLFLLAALLMGMMANAVADEGTDHSPSAKGFMTIAGDVYRVANAPYAGMLPLYAEDTVTSAVKARFYNGTVGILTHTKGEWGYLYIGDIKGYVQLDMLAPVGVAVPSAMQEAMVTNANGAELFLFGENRITASVPYRTRLCVLGMANDKAIVQYGGMTWHVNMHNILIQPALDSSLTVTPQPAIPASTPKPFVFTGPVGDHDTAQWPLKIVEYLAAVNNPDPDDRLNLRTGPGKNFKSLGKYYNGVQVVINGAVETNEKGEEWVKVSVCGLDGYMENRFLAYEQKDYPASVLPVMKVKNPNSAKNLNLRERQTMESVSLGVYPNGTEVILMGFTGEWAHVIVDGQTGFMMAKYLK